MRIGCSAAGKEGQDWQHASTVPIDLDDDQHASVDSSPILNAPAQVMLHDLPDQPGSCSSTHLLCQHLELLLQSTECWPGCRVLRQARCTQGGQHGECSVGGCFQPLQVKRLPHKHAGHGLDGIQRIPLGRARPLCGAAAAASRRVRRCHEQIARTTRNRHILSVAQQCTKQRQGLPLLHSHIHELVPRGAPVHQLPHNHTK
jgi:hypothetical protein